MLSGFRDPKRFLIMGKRREERDRELGCRVCLRLHTEAANLTSGAGARG